MDFPEDRNKFHVKLPEKSLFASCLKTSLIMHAFIQHSTTHNAICANNLKHRNPRNCDFSDLMMMNKLYTNKDLLIAARSHIFLDRP